MKNKNIVRIIFWVVFLSGAVYALYYMYDRNMSTIGISKKIDLLIPKLSHPNAKVASDAWWELRELYYTKWAAFHQLLTHTADPEPINFLIERDTRPVPGQAAVMDFVANGKAIFYKTDTIYCRTRGEAILAFVYNERKSKVEFAGDWNAWWQAARKDYGK